MKQIFILLTLLLLPIVLAKGLTVYTDDFSIKPIQVISLGEKDRISLDLLNASHTIIIDRIYKDSATLDIFPYLKNVTYVTVSYDKYIRLDINRDHNIDMLIYLNNVGLNNITLTLKKVSITQESILINDTDAIPTGETVLETPKQVNSLGVIIIISLILAGILIYFILIKTKII